MMDNGTMPQGTDAEVCVETGKLTEESIQEEINAFYPINPEGVRSKRLSDGNGLFLQLTKSGKYFKYQASLQRRGSSISLGTYPQLSLEQARKMAKRCSTKIQSERSKLQSQRITRNIGELVNRARGCSCPFANLDRLTRFSQLLISRINWARITVEDRVALTVALLIPAPSADIFCAKRDRLDSHRPQWWFESARRRKEEPNCARPQKLVYIPNAARKILDAWAIGNQSGEIFPSLLQEKARARTHRLNRVLDDLWPYERVKVDDFRLCFEAMAKKFSYFKPQLIEDAMNCEPKDDSSDNSGYERQRFALADWWADVLEFNDSQIDFKDFLILVAKSSPKAIEQFGNASKYRNSII